MFYIIHNDKIVDTMWADFSQIIGNYNQLWLFGGIAIAVLGAVLAILIVRRKKISPQVRIIEQTIRQICDDYKANVVLSDGIYGYHFIDYLLLLPGRIVVIGLQNIDGYIFGGEQMDEWAQVVDQKSYKFSNPVLSNLHYVNTVENLTRGVEVLGRVIFTGENSFPKGVPPGVIKLSNLEIELKELADNARAEKSVKEIWDNLITTANEHILKYNEEVT